MARFSLLSIVREAAKAGALAAVEVRERGGLRVVGLGEGGDAALEGDVAAERAVIETLKRRVGSFTLVSEEAGEREYGDGGPPIFVVDPLDGSRNYKLGVPIYATSVAAAWGFTLDEVVAAAVYAPALKLEFYAEKGRGAYLGERRLRVSTGDMVVALNTTPKVRFLPHALALALSLRGAVVRALGSACLELAFVAAGYFDAYVDAWFATRVVDVAAALLLAREAGAWLHVEGVLAEPPLLSIKERMCLIAASSRMVGEVVDAAMRDALGFGIGEARKWLLGEGLSRRD